MFRDGLWQARGGWWLSEVDPRPPGTGPEYGHGINLRIVLGQVHVAGAAIHGPADLDHVSLSELGSSVPFASELTCHVCRPVKEGMRIERTAEPEGCYAIRCRRGRKYARGA